MTAEGLASLHSTRRFLDHGRSPRSRAGCRRSCAAPAPDVARGARQRPACAGHHRQPGLFALGRAPACAAPIPTLPIIDYVSPSVWAWRPWRARVDAPLHRPRPGAAAVRARRASPARRPACSYVGHPIIEQVAQLRPNAEEARRRAAAPPVVLVLPGSRSGEIAQLAAIFGETIGRVARPDRPARGGGADRAASRSIASPRRPPPGRSSRASSPSRPTSRRRFGSRARRWPSPAPSRWSSRWPACRWSRPTRCRRSTPWSCRRVDQACRRSSSPIW